MYSLRKTDGTKIAGLQYKPSIGSRIKIDGNDEWYEVTEVKGRVAYARTTLQPTERG